MYVTHHSILYSKSLLISPINGHPVALPRIRPLSAHPRLSDPAPLGSQFLFSLQIQRCCTFHFIQLQTAPYLFLACAVIFNCKKCSLKKIALVFPLAAFTIASSMFAGQCLSILPLQTYLSIRQGTALVIFLILVLQGHVRDFGRKIMCLVGILIGALILGGNSLTNTSRVQYLYGLLFSLSEAGSLLLCAYLWRKKL